MGVVAPNFKLLLEKGGEAIDARGKEIKGVIAWDWDFHVPQTYWLPDDNITILRLPTLLRALRKLDKALDKIEKLL
jgi:hypothetical protein